MKNSEQTDVILVGYGFGGRVFHAPLVAAVSRLRLAGVVTSRQAEVAAAYPGVPVFPSLERALDAVPAGLVVISTPNTSHFPLAQQALRAGRHVVVDKPFTITAAEADQLIALANEQGRLLSVFHNRRWDSDYLTLRRLAEEGALGEIHTYQAHYDRFRPEVRDRWRERDEPGAGLLYDLGSHLIDQAVQLLGRPERVWADLGRQRPGAQSDDYFHVVLRLGERRAILHGGSLVAQPPFRFAVHGTRGSFIKHGLDPQEEQLIAGKRPGDPGWGEEAAGSYGTLTQVAGGRVESRIVPAERGRYEAYYEGIAAAMRGERPVPVSALEARNVIAIIEAAQESAGGGREVELSEMLT